MTERNQNNVDKFKTIFSYLPLYNIYLFLTEDKNKSKELFVHIKYSLMIFGIFIILYIIFWILFLWFLQPILVLAYIWIILFIMYKINAWDKVDFKVLDDLEKNIKNKFK